MHSLQDKAREVLDSNAKKGNGYYYVAPSPKKYPHQWSWDSSFHAIVNAGLGRAHLAMEEVLTLLAKMLPDGRLPHIVSHGRSLTSLSNRLFRRHWPQPDRSPFVQPPVIALAVKEIWEQSEDTRFLRESLPFLVKHFEWLSRERSADGSKLVSIFSPWESGLDHKPAFDRLLGRAVRLPLGLYLALYLLELRVGLRKYDPVQVVRRGLFNVKEVLFNAVYVLGLESLAALCKAAGDHSRGEQFQGQAAETERALLEKCYDPATGLYYDLDCRTGRLVPEPSISCLMPLILGNMPGERYRDLVGRLTDRRQFWPRFPVPSVPVMSRHFRPDSTRYLWRGPTWINTNWLLAAGLKRNGYGAVAEEIAARSRDLVRDSGFREYYNPLTGKGGGARDFGWSTLAAVI